MKIKLLLAITIFSICTGGCSSVSKEDYDAKVEELEMVQKELESVQENLKTTQKEYAEYKGQIVEEEMKKSGARAWAETAFGTNAYTIINDTDLYVNIPTGYTLSEKSIESLLNKLFSGMSLYTTYYQAEPDQLPYDSITIIVLEENTKLDMLSIQFLKNSDGTFTQTATMINMNDSVKILSYINKALQ